MELWVAPVSSLPRGGPARTWQVDGQRGTGTGSPPPALAPHPAPCYPAASLSRPEGLSPRLGWALKASLPKAPRPGLWGP